MTMDIFETLVIWASGFVVGWMVMGKLAKLGMIEILQNLDLPKEKLLEALRKSNADFMIEDEEGNDITDHIAIRIEKVNGQLLAYRENDNTFIAQGIDAKDLLDHIADRFEGKNFRVDESKGAEHLKGYI